MKVLTFACLLAVALANDPSQPSYVKPDYLPTARYQNPTENYAPMPHNFEWSVYDQASYNDYAHQANSDGKVVTGSYRVLLPDSRVQIVTYKADEYGYVADVKYEGEAKYVSKTYTGNGNSQSNYPNDYDTSSYKPKEYSPNKYSADYKRQSAYPAKPYNAEVYSSRTNEAEGQSYPLKYTPAKYNDQEYPTNNDAAYAYPTGKQYPEPHIQPGYKAGQATHGAQPTYRQPNYTTEDSVREYTTPKTY